MLLKALASIRTARSVFAAYDPQDSEQRQLLAETMSQRLKKAGFRLLPTRGGQEDVYVFDHLKAPGFQVKVYTTIQGGRVRSKDADAIRVCLVYADEAARKGGEGRTLGISSECRVVRRGEIDAIVERTLERARDAYRRVSETERCRACGAPMATSKAGKPYCAERCWLR
jgi:hypothetical protein